MMRCPKCETTYPGTWSVCPQCHAGLTSFSTNRLTPPTERARRRDTVRMSGSLTNPPGVSASTTSPLDDLLTPPPRRRWPIVVGLVIGLAIVGGWWLSQHFGSMMGAESSPTALAGEVLSSDEPAPDELVQFIAHSLENNLITSSANPLLTPAERKELVTEALADVRDPTVRQKIYRQHRALAAEMKRQGRGKEAWYEHIAVCQKVCRSAFSALTDRYFAKVSQHIHQAVMFDTGSDQLDSSSRRDISHFADLLMSQMYADQRILLIGRASRLGAHGYNMALSERRVHAVKNELQRWGVAPERIKEFWLGWEQPYLTRTVAQLYRIPGFLFDDDEIKLNQSVMMVLY